MENEGQTPLSSIFNSGITTDSSESSPAPAATEVDNSSDSKSAEDTSSSPSDKKDDNTQKPVDKKSDEGSASDKPDDKSSDKPADDASKKADSSVDTKTAEDKKAADPYEQRWKDTAAWANREHQEKLQLQQQVSQLTKAVEVMRKQIADPNYDPATDPANQGPTHEQVADTSLKVGKALASRNAAMSMYGQEQVNNALAHFQHIFGENEHIQKMVLDSDSPVLEAMRQVDRHYFEQQYGNTPRQMYDNIKKEVTEELRASIRKELLAEIDAGATKKDKTSKGLSGSRGSNGADRGQPASSNVTPLSQIFPN